MTSKTFYQEVEFTVDLDEFHDDDIIEAVYHRNLQDEFRDDYLTLHSCSDEQLLQELEDRNQFYFDTVEMQYILEKLYQLRRTGQDVTPLLDAFLADALGRIV